MVHIVEKVSLGSVLSLNEFMEIIDNTFKEQGKGSAVNVARTNKQVDRSDRPAIVARTDFLRNDACRSLRSQMVPIARSAQ